MMVENSSSSFEFKPSEAHNSDTHKVPLNMVVHHSNPFLVDMPQVDTETINIGKHGFMSSMEKENIEDSAPYSYAPRENRHVIDKDILKSSLNEDEHEEVACSIRAAEFATEWNPFLADVSKLDNVTVTPEEHGFTSSIDDKIFESNIEDEDSLDVVERMEARCSIRSAEEVPYYIAHHNNPFLIDMLILDNEIVTEGEHVLTLPIEKKIFEDRKPCKELEPAQYSLGHGRDEENVDRIKTSLSEYELAKVPYSIVHQGNPFLVDVPELDDDSVTGGQHGFTLPLMKKIFVEEMQLPSQWIYAQGEENFRINEANMKNTQSEDAQMEVLCSPNATEFDTNFYADKIISETERCKEGSCSVIKDICYDEVVNSPEKIATGIKEPNGNICSELNHFPSDRDNIVMEGAATSTMTISHDMKASPVNGNSISVFDNDVEEKLGAGSLPEAGEKPDSTYQDEKGNSAAMIVPFDAKAFKPSHDLGETPADSLVKSGIITFNFDSTSTNISSGKENRDDKEHQTSVRDALNRGIEDTATDVATASTQNSVLHTNRGESGFSGPIIASGRIPFSGSISHRSDSSTTSARSFAFPILPTEWSSSPVKMAKADHRQLRKQRCWRMVFFCCRF